MSVECAMQWNDSYQESVQCFTNNIPQRDGGTHLTALRQEMKRYPNPEQEFDGFISPQQLPPQLAVAFADRFYYKLKITV